MLSHYIKIAVRNLRKYSSQTIISTLGLTTACVVFTVSCHMVFLVMTRNTTYPDHERMYEVRTRNNQTIRGDMRKTISELSGVESFTFFSGNRQYEGLLHAEGNGAARIIKLSLMEADTSLWDFFTLKEPLNKTPLLFHCHRMTVQERSR